MPKIISNTPQLSFPQLSIFMGAPKVGKSRAMAELPRALIVDLEGRGYRAIEVKHLISAQDDGSALDINTLKEIIRFFFSKENVDYDTLVIDHLRVLTTMFTERIEKEHGVEYLEEISFGKGTSSLSRTIFRFFKSIEKHLSLHPTKRVFVVAHALERNGTISLDVDGKNEGMILSLVDGVGFISKDPSTKETMIEFGSRRGVEFGCRNPHLANYKGVLKWDTLFTLAEGKALEKKKITK